MSAHYEGDTIDEAWLAVVEGVNADKGGRTVFTTVTVNRPDVDANEDVRAVLDARLVAKGRPTTATVANTLFASGLYSNPGFDWDPALSDNDQATVNQAAEDLYARYLFALPTIMSLRANAAGTYFSRMINWPGTAESGGVNQLAKRIHYLREVRKLGHQSHNASDITTGSEIMEADEVHGVQAYAATDDRQQAFPCLVHISITVHDGHLSLCATYRHWFLITRGYGNLVGLARLQRFLAQQSGYKVGSLMVVGTKANAERDRWGGAAGVKSIHDEAAMTFSSGALMRAAVNL